MKKQINNSYFIGFLMKCYFLGKKMIYTPHFTPILHIYRMFVAYFTFTIHGSKLVIFENFINGRIKHLFPFFFFFLCFHLPFPPESNSSCLCYPLLPPLLLDFVLMGCMEINLKTFFFCP